MAQLKGPFEILDLADGGVLKTRISAWEEGEGTYKFARAPEGLTVKTLRITVPTEDKTTVPPYWDITSQLLIAALGPWLQRSDFALRTYTITKRGTGPSARFMLEVL